MSGQLTPGEKSTKYQVDRRMNYRMVVNRKIFALPGITLALPTCSLGKQQSYDIN